LPPDRKRPLLSPECVCGSIWAAARDWLRAESGPFGPFWSFLALFCRTKGHSERQSLTKVAQSQEQAPLEIELSLARNTLHCVPPNSTPSQLGGHFRRLLFGGKHWVLRQNGRTSWLVSSLLLARWVQLARVSPARRRRLLSPRLSLLWSKSSHRKSLAECCDKRATSLSRLQFAVCSLLTSSDAKCSCVQVSSKRASQKRLLALASFLCGSRGRL